MLKRGRWAIGAVSMLLGIMLVSQYRMTQTLADSNVRVPAFNGTFREEYIKSSTSQGGTTK